MSLFPKSISLLLFLIFLRRVARTLDVQKQRFSREIEIIKFSYVILWITPIYDLFKVLLVPYSDSEYFINVIYCLVIVT